MEYRILIAGLEVQIICTDCGKVIVTVSDECCFDSEELDKHDDECEQ